MNLFDQKKNCNGCSACKSVCPKAAIEMIVDEEGFFYPKVDEKRCNHCGLCENVCPCKKNGDISMRLENSEFYAVKHRDDNVRKNSQSGGAFTAISDEILRHGGVIYGAGYAEDFTVCHKKAETIEERNELRGSKYVQSDLKNIFQNVKNDLNSGKLVLFTGTPCQVAGLASCLKSHPLKKNLYLVDLICHGVPSPRIWNDYLNFLCDKYKSEIKKTNFRDKLYGWRSHIETISFKDYEYSNVLFVNLFYQHFILRPSCHNCKFTNLRRPSDLTIADCWGIENYLPEFMDENGVSLIMLNTKKGKSVFEKIQPAIQVKPYSLGKCRQPLLFNPTQPSEKREEFWKKYKEESFEYILKHYAGYGWKNRIKIRLSFFLYSFSKKNIF